MLCTSGLLACRHPAFAPHYVVFNFQKSRLLLVSNQISFVLYTSLHILGASYWRCALLSVTPFHLSFLELPQSPISIHLSPIVSNHKSTQLNLWKPRWSYSISNGNKVLLQFHIFTTIIKSRKGIIIETNFWPRHRAETKTLNPICYLYSDNS